MGIAFGYFLKELVDERFVSADKIHLIGIDLGAHIAGSSGRAFNKLTKTKIERITGQPSVAPLYFQFVFTLRLFQVWIH